MALEETNKYFYFIHKSHKEKIDWISKKTLNSILKLFKDQDKPINYNFNELFNPTASVNRNLENSLKKEIINDLLDKYEKDKSHKKYKSFRKYIQLNLIKIGLDVKWGITKAYDYAKKMRTERIKILNSKLQKQKKRKAKPR